MAKIIVPHANKREKAIFEKFNVNFIDSIDEKGLKEEIITYLNQHNVLHLATCRDDEPRSTPRSISITVLPCISSRKEAVSLPT